MNVRLLVLFVWLPIAAHAQGFAGLGAPSDGFAQPTPNPQFSFPRDDGAHSDFRIEWWYVTANLTDGDGTDYGLQWTLFRTALAPEDGEGWSSPQLWMGHAAVTTPDDHFVTERLARGGIGQAGVTVEPFAAWIDEWAFEGSMDAAELRANGSDFGYDMTLTTNRPIVLHGDKGYSLKSDGKQASYYYSQPFFQASGTLHLPQGDVAVSGQAWLDREWSSQPLADDQTGWDWFSLSFDDGAKMMGFQLRGSKTYTSATWISAEGKTTALPDGAFMASSLKISDVGGRSIPTTWAVRLAEMDIDVVVEAINNNAWMDTSVPYWEGPVRITGTHTGRGYLEMTGYE